MAAGDAAIVREMYERFNRGEFEAATEMLHPDATMYQAAEIPDSDVYRGRDEFVRGITRWLSGFEPGFQYLPGEARDVGDLVYIDVTLRGVGRESGVPLDDRIFHVWDVRDGMPCSCWVYFDEAQARAKAGVAG